MKEHFKELKLYEKENLAIEKNWFILTEKFKQKIKQGKI